ncbi:MAG: transcription-repair coupling factor, partial [Cyanobacteriota bacterium]|nr:transcription-repair coupling factor [Cyanobacteriota bacterium]
MTFSAIVRATARSPLTRELLSKLNQHQSLYLNGVPRLPKGLVASALAQKADLNLFVVTATLEEAGRWSAQLEAMGWSVVHFYPTSEGSPYDSSSSEEMVWGQMQVLADLVNPDGREKTAEREKIAIVATERSLQPHLPPVEAFKPYCLTLKQGETQDSKQLDEQLVTLGYERVSLVEMEGQWSRRGDIVDIFPVAAELPVRLEWFGDELERIREFDPTTQRSLDKIQKLVLTPTDFTPWGIGTQEWKIDQAASVLDYLPELTLVAIDEPDLCAAHGDRWYDLIEQSLSESSASNTFPKLHQPFKESLAEISAQFDRLFLSELAEVSPSPLVADSPSLNLSSRPVPITPHQFAKLADLIRTERNRHFSIFLVSAQPSRSVSLLSEHDCPAKFVPNPRDYPAIEGLIQDTPVALKYTGLAELEGFILPTLRLVVVTDR